MSQTPFFSIGIPVYNTEKWVGRCLDTVLSQSFTDFEIVCVDDGSTDNSLEILNAYSKKDPRVKVFSRENGGSASSVRNAIIGLSQGVYIQFLDSDDELCEEALLDAYYSILKQNYPDLLQAGFIKNHWGKITYRLPAKPCLKKDFEEIEGRQLTKDEYAGYMFLRDEVIGMLASKFIKREFLNISGVRFNEKYYSREDGDFSFYLIRRADTVAVGDFYSYIYFLPREGSISTKESAKTVISTLRYYMDFYDDVSNWDIPDSLLKQIRQAQTGFFYDGRIKLMDVFYKGRSREECFKIIDGIDRVMGQMIKRLPVKGEGVKNRIIYTLFKVIGIKATMKMLYSYLRLRKVV